MKWSFYLTYATRSLFRNGQRTFIAILCVAFGVMSLVSLQLLATMVHNAVIIDPRVKQGGDAVLFRTSGSLSELRTDDLEQLKSDGIIQSYLLLNQRSGLLVKRADNGQVYTFNRALGVDPTTYPLVGTIALRDGQALASAIANAGDAVLSRDLADRLGLKQGDTFTLSSYPSGDSFTFGSNLGGNPIPLRVAGIADRMPDHGGDTVIYNLETARLFAGRSDMLNQALVIWGLKGTALATAQCQGDGTLSVPTITDADRILCGGSWSFETAAAANETGQRIINVFDPMLKGAGLLGLLVGGIGVANTLQVLLARRNLEIAMLKTLGYSRRDVVSLIAVETALLGLTGSIVGALAAVGLSYPFMTLLGRTGSIIMEWSIDPVAIASGLLAGVATAMIFGLVASVRASEVRPASLLRNQLEAQPRSSRLTVIGMWVGLGVLFAVMSSLIMGSIVYGAGLVALAVVGMALLGLVFSLALAAIVRLPLPGHNILTLAQNNLKRQSRRSLFALMALFAGVFSIGFASTALLRAESKIESRRPNLSNENLVVYGSTGSTGQVQSVLAQQNITQTRSSLLVQTEVYAAGNMYLSNQIEGIDSTEQDPTITKITGAPLGTQAGVYLDADLIEGLTSSSNTGSEGLNVGDPITLTTSSGVQVLPIVGVFMRPSQENNRNSLSLPEPQVLVSGSVARQIGGEATTAMFVAKAPPEMLRIISVDVSKALPALMVLSTADLTDATLRVLFNLFSFVVAVAGLALVAGMVLIANAVGLTLVERRRELGILKSVGYSSGQVLRTMLVEYAVLGLLSGIAGVAAVIGTITYLNMSEPYLELSLGPLPALIITGVAVLLAGISTALVAWKPTHIRPLAVLRES